MPSSDVGSEVFKNFALYCCPWVRSLIHSPDAVTHSPAEITAAWPTTVISSRWPRALIRRTQKPFSSLWKVMRSTRPASTSRSDGLGSIFMNPVTGGGVPLASTDRSGNPVDSAALNIAYRSTRGGPLIDCTQQILRWQPAILRRTTNCDRRPFAPRPDEMADPRRMARLVP